MPPKESKAVPESNGPVPQQEQFGSGQPTLAGVYRMMNELFDRSDRRLEKLSDEMGRMGQRLASLEQDARQATSCHGGRRASKREGSQAHGGRR